MEEDERISQRTRCLCTAHGHTQLCGDGQREGERGQERWPRGVGNGDICSGVNNKNKVKTREYPERSIFICH